MRRGLKRRLSGRAGWSMTSLVVSLLTICPLAAQNIDLPNADLPLHAKVSSGSSFAGRTSGPADSPAGGAAAIRPAQFEETISPGIPAGPVLIDDDGFPLDGAARSDVIGPAAAGPCPPTAYPGCFPVNCEMTPERRWYMERHFGPGSVAQADGMARFEPSYSCIDNNFYAAVAPPSPFLPLGGDSPFPDSWTSWFHKASPPADPQDDPACPAAPPAPDSGTSAWFPGTGWYPNGSPCYLGNCFEKHGGCCGKFWSWVWKHNTAQYMWENFHLFAGPQGFKSPTDLFQDGNFGLHEGLNWGMPVWDDIGLGYQKGFQCTAEQLERRNRHGRVQPLSQPGLRHGRSVPSPDRWRRRARGAGDRLFERQLLRQDQSDPAALRNQLSRGRGTTKSDSVPPSISTRQQRHFALHACSRRRFRPRTNTTSSSAAISPRGPTAACGVALPADGDGLVGGDATLYLSDRWALNSAFNYLIPKHDAGRSGHAARGFGADGQSDVVARLSHAGLAVQSLPAIVQRGRQHDVPVTPK